RPRSRQGRRRWLALIEAGFSSHAASEAFGSGIGKGVWRKIAVCNPFDARRKLAIRLDEFLDCLPRFLERYEEPKWQWRIVHAPDPFLQTAQISLRAVSVIDVTAPFRVDEKNAQLRVAPHCEIDIDAALVPLQMFGSISSFRQQASTVVFGLKEPLLPWGSEEVAFQLVRVWPSLE